MHILGAFLLTETLNIYSFNRHGKNIKDLWYRFEGFDIENSIFENLNFDDSDF